MTDSPTPSLGKMIDQMHQLRESYREINQKAKDAKAALDAQEDLVKDALLTQQIQSAGGETASASITEEVVPNIDSWDEFIDWVRDNDAFYLFQRRINGGAFRELLTAGQDVDGLSPFTKLKVSLRTK